MTHRRRHRPGTVAPPLTPASLAAAARPSPSGATAPPAIAATAAWATRSRPGSSGRWGPIRASPTC
ncbi:hypothetical protein H6G65_02570 [Microcystis elabens FACHB-917]|nr:hypothetical protein [Microcystis elabens FACHB-917]